MPMPKAATSVAEARQLRRHNPLEDDLLATGPLRSKPSKRKSGKQEDSEENYVDSRASRNILRIGQELADEEEEIQRIPKPNTAFDFNSRFEDEDQEAGYEDEEAWGDEDEVVEEAELAPEDLETFSKFFPVQEDPLLRQGWGGAAEESDQEQGTNLADLILAKIAAHEAAQEGQNISGQPRGGAAIVDDYELPPKVIEVYTKYDPEPGFSSSNANNAPPESDSSSPATNLENSPNPSKSSPPSPTGKTSSP
jgi:essential nuclear protein 1